MEVEKNDSLIVIEKLNAIDVFTGPEGIEKILAEVEKKVAEHKPDVSTAKGRKEIASVAYKVSQSKVLLDDLGKNLVTDWKQKAAQVDASRKIARDRLDVLRDKARLPLTEWEEAEEIRLAAEKLEKEISDAHDAALAEHALYLRAKEIERKEAELAKIEAERKAKEEAEQKEREAVAALEKAEAARVANEERIRKEAEEKAKLEAEAAAKAAIEEAERKEREAKEAAEKSERARLAAIAEAEEREIAAEKRAKEEREAAVKAAEEKARIEAERVESERKAKEEAARAKAEAEQKEEERRTADLEHRRTINREAMEGLKAAGLSEKAAKDVLTAIIGGMVKHVSIKY